MSTPLRIVFWGTPDLGIPVLKALNNSPDFDVVAVVSQPDKPQGRKHEILPTPIKKCALELDIPVYQPSKLSSEEVLSHLRSLNADFFVVMAYGKIVKQEVLDIPKIAPVNIHVSLLPKHRGASPIQASLLAGDTETGVTFMRMTAGMDEGPILSQQLLPIQRKWNAGDVFTHLAELSQKHVCEVLSHYANGSIKEEEQDSTKVTHCKKITKQMGEIDWHTWNAQVLYRAWQAYTPWPGVYSYIYGKRVKLLKIRSIEAAELEALLSEDTLQGATKVGHMYLQDDRLFVRTKAGFVELLSLQTEGKKPLNALEWYNGLNLKQFDLGSEHQPT